MTFLLSPLGRALILGTLLFGAIYMLYSNVRSAGFDDGAASVQTKFDAYVAEQKRLAAVADAEAREVERQQRAKYHALAETYEQEKTNAEERIKRDFAAGTVRLRREWAGCETALLSTTAASAALVDELARLREEGARNLVGLAAQCDAQIRGLQGLVR